MQRLTEILTQRFDTQRCGDLDTHIAFCSEDKRLLIGIHDGRLTFPDEADQRPDLQLYFASEEQAVDIMAGAGNPIEAFMAGEFRSSGYILWVFQVLAAFSRPIDVAAFRA